jgi:hypothetical protein
MFPGFPALWICENGSIPTRSWFLSYLHRHFPTTIAGHSLRAGGATALALAGFPNDRIQAAGRWSSSTFLSYIRKNPFLLQALLHAPSSPTPQSYVLPLYLYHSLRIFGVKTAHRQPPLWVVVFLRPKQVLSAEKPQWLVVV